MKSYLLEFALTPQRQDTTAAPVPTVVAMERPVAKTGEFVCPQCQAGFSSERGRKTHVRQVHELQQYGQDWRPQR